MSKDTTPRNLQNAGGSLLHRLGLVLLLAATTLTAQAQTTGNDDGVDNLRQVIFNTQTSSVPYRIPVLAQALNGDIFALGDYRPAKVDIGVGKVYVHARVSSDEGATWGEEFCVAGENAVSGNDTQYYGDASICADRERNEVLVMLVAGQVAYSRSTRNNPIRVARTRAILNEATGEWEWTKTDDITTAIYNLLPNVAGLFFTSGKICQSSKIKVGDYYRIYSGLCTRSGNFVLYSDDLGRNWKVLGSSSSSPISGGDECKCEELPNGNVLLSSRVAKGRYWNIFTYTDQASATGSWGTASAPSSTNGGIYNQSDGSPCNGEILLVDAIRQSDNQEVRLALQSVATSRTNVTIWYKPLTSTSDYSTPANFAKSWEGKYQVSSTTSCYSTMIQQQSHRIGFYFEENSVNSGYNLVYYRYPLETITNGAYRLKVPETPVVVGDVDGDGQVAPADVTALVNILLGLDSSEPYKYDHEAADVNGDGQVTLADVTALVNILLGGK